MHRTRCKKGIRWRGRSLRVNTETCDLGEIRCRRKVQDMHVVKDVVSVEPAKNEEPRVGEDRYVIASWGGGTAESRPWLIL